MADSSIDLFLKESCKSFEKCRVKNSARRNSLQKKTEHLNFAMRKVSNKHNREEKLLRQELDAIQRGKPEKSQSPRGMSPSRKLPRTKPESTGRVSLEARSRRVRRESKEFEDLHLVSSTGKLKPAPSIVKDSGRLNKAYKAGSTTDILSPINDDSRTVNQWRKSDERIRKASKN